MTFAPTSFRDVLLKGAVSLPRRYREGRKRKGIPTRHFNPRRDDHAVLFRVLQPMDLDNPVYREFAPGEPVRMALPAWLEAAGVSLGEDNDNSAPNRDAAAARTYPQPPHTTSTRLRTRETLRKALSHPLPVVWSQLHIPACSAVSFRCRCSIETDAAPSIPACAFPFLIPLLRFTIGRLDVPFLWD